MNICYFLGSESQADDWELRYSMRSWRANYLPFAAPPHLIPVVDPDCRRGRFIIIGHKPSWLSDTDTRVAHYPMPDPYRSNKDANLIQKLIFLVAKTGWDKGIICSDDQFLLRPAVDAEMTVPRHAGPISEFKRQKGHSWQERLWRTGEVLRKRKLTDFHYDTHIPHVVTRAQIMELLRWNYGEGNGYCVFSLLFNASGAVGERIDKSPIRAGLYGAEIKKHTITEKIGSNLFMSIDGDSLRCADLVRAIEAKWPEAAPWELYPPTSPLDMKNLHPPKPVTPPPPMDASAQSFEDFNYNQYLIS